MNNDFVLVDPKAWEYDLHSIYSAYIGYFQVYNIPWYERSWGHFFESFDGFLGFTWPVITVTDAWTGKPHIVTRLSAITSFIKMIKTRFGETLPQAPNILQISPFESSQRRQRHVSDYVTYSRLHATLPAAYIAAVKARVRAGEPKVVKELWENRDKTFLTIDFEVNERNERTVMEWGYAALRCGHLEALGHWPPSPDTNYRKGHYIVAEYADKIINKHTPTHPWQYAFGDSQVISKTKLPDIIETVISSLASPDSETAVNTLVLVAHGIQSHLARLDEMKIKLPSNMIALDTSVLERAMYNAGHRPVMMDPKTEKPRVHGTMLSLEKMLISLTLPPLSYGSGPTANNDTGLPPSHSNGGGATPNGNHTGLANASHDSSSPKRAAGGAIPLPAQAVPIVLPKCALNNAGNDAFMTLLAFQQLMEPHVAMKTPAVKQHVQAHQHGMRPTSYGGGGGNGNGSGGINGPNGVPRPRVLSHASGMAMAGPGMGWPGMMPMSLTPPITMGGPGSAPGPGLMVPTPYGAAAAGAYGGSMTMPAMMHRHSGYGFPPVGVGMGDGMGGSMGANGGGGKQRSHAAYDLAGEFGNLTVSSKTGSSGGSGESGGKEENGKEKEGVRRLHVPSSGFSSMRLGR